MIERSLALGALRRIAIGRLHEYAARPRVGAGGISLAEFCRGGRTPAEAAGRFSWEPAVTRRLFNALEGSGVFAPGTNAGLFKTNEAFTPPAPDELSRWMDSGIEGISGIRSFQEISKESVGLGSIASLDSMDPEKDYDSLVILWYCRFILARFMSEEAVSASLSSGRSHASRVLGVGSDCLFDHYQSSPLILATFAASFSALNAGANQFAAAELDPRPGDSILDVGGGAGGLAAAIAARHPACTIDIYDHPLSRPVLESIESHWTGPYRDRIRREYGDLPKNTGGGLSGLAAGKRYDLVLLSWIFPDWDDGVCAGILGRARRHLKPGGRIALLDKYKGDKPSFVDVADFILFLMTGGQERSLDECRAIIQSAGMGIREHRINPTGRDILFLGDAA